MRAVTTSRNGQAHCGGGGGAGNTEVTGEIGRREKHDQASISGCSAGPPGASPVPGAKRVPMFTERTNTGGSSEAWKSSKRGKRCLPCPLSPARTCPKRHRLSYFPQPLLSAEKCAGRSGSLSANLQRSEKVSSDLRPSAAVVR